ncbi:MAG: sugar ABC transporter ATP-binding protein [Actinobacteria bacterium]|nr:sugar ABC transporter ATP-binding protein [Actinomycetota bacterium]
MENLSFVHKKIVLILKALSKNSKMIILDEPTASLHKEEADKLFKYIKEFKSTGVTFIYISHYLDEIFQVCDDVTILKDGEVVKNGEVKQFNMGTLIEGMLGKKLKEEGYFAKVNHDVGNKIFEVKNLNDKKGVIENVTFSLGKGEVLSLAGIKGSGKEEIVDMLFGFIPKKSGAIFIKGKEIKNMTVRNIFNNGMYFIPEDRHRKGLILEFSVANNISIASLFKVRNKFGFLSPNRERLLAEKYINTFSINTPTINQLVKFLSGGNQQKVVFSKVMSTEPEILLLHEPTVGIDVGTKSEVHKIIENLARSGISIILVTEELDEILNMSDRVIIIFKGKFIKEINRGEKEFNREDLILYMERGVNA